jgi:ring-1,2-phenylacetyl-CoA epoxidase subunit PaaD
MQAKKAQTARDDIAQQIWAWLAEVPDPEIPVLSVLDLGIVRDVQVESDAVEVSVSPTYSGCPATEVIEHSIIAKLRENGVENVSLRRVLSPPWTTDWISEAGRDKLREFGIAPPDGTMSKRELLGDSRTVACPRCHVDNTTLVSEFGSTPCKASYKCDECLEPFEYFKCI